MSPPPLRLYGCMWLIYSCLFGAIAWFLWKSVWLAAACGAVLGVATMAAGIALRGGRTPEPGPRDPDDPRR